MQVTGLNKIRNLDSFDIIYSNDRSIVMTDLKVLFFFFVCLPFFSDATLYVIFFYSKTRVVDMC